MSRSVPAFAEWSHLERRVRALVPEAFDKEGRVLNLVAGEWGYPGAGKPYLSPVDGTVMGRLPMLDAVTARNAASAAAS